MNDIQNIYYALQGLLFAMLGISSSIIVSAMMISAAIRSLKK